MIGGACQPDWSPDGLHLVFISPCLARQNDHPGAKLYVINVDGGGLTELPSLESGGFDPAWSPDGKRIAFASSQNNLAQIFVINLDNYLVTPLTTESSDFRLPDWARQPAWSPDGKQIAYTGHSRLTNALQIWIMSDLGQEQMVLINRGPTYWNFLPKWSPDGKSILFSETKGPQVLGWLMVLDYENRQNAEAVHLRLGSFGDHGSYSPDGAWVVYENINIAILDTTNYHIVILKNGESNPPIDLPGSGPGSMDFDPAWRPVGSP
jgi:Tol biopolymer transport system component